MIKTLLKVIVSIFLILFLLLYVVPYYYAQITTRIPYGLILAVIVFAFQVRDSFYKAVSLSLLTLLIIEGIRMIIVFKPF